MQWIMAYPWMTFWLIVLLLIVIDGAVSNISKVIMVSRLSKNNRIGNKDIEDLFSSKDDDK